MCHLALVVPTSNLYAQLNGLQLSVDPASVLWIGLFSRGLLNTLDQVKAFYHLQDSSKADEHVDIRMDAAHLKVDRRTPTPRITSRTACVLHCVHK